MKNRFYPRPFVALLFGLLACSKGSSSGASGKLKVVTTNSILADITKKYC